MDTGVCVFYTRIQCRGAFGGGSFYSPLDLLKRYCTIPQMESTQVYILYVHLCTFKSLNKRSEVELFAQLSFKHYSSMFPVHHDQH